MRSDAASPPEARGYPPVSVQSRRGSGSGPAVGGRSGQGGRRVRGDAVQFVIDREVELRGAAADLGELRLELRDAATQSPDLEGENLLVRLTYVSQEGACHVATLRF